MIGKSGKAAVLHPVCCLLGCGPCDGGRWVAAATCVVLSWLKAPASCWCACTLGAVVDVSLINDRPVEVVVEASAKVDGFAGGPEASVDFAACAESVAGSSLNATGVWEVPRDHVPGEVGRLGGSSSVADTGCSDLVVGVSLGAPSCS